MQHNTESGRTRELSRPRTRSWVCRQTAETTSDRRSDRASRTRFRIERYAPVKSVSPNSPFIVARRCIRAGSVAEISGCEHRDERAPLAGNVSSRGSGASESRMRVGTFACAKREPPQVGLAPACRLPDTLLSPRRTRMNVGTRHTRGGGPELPTFGRQHRVATMSSLGNPPREGRDPGEERKVPSVRLDAAAGGIAPFHVAQHRSPRLPAAFMLP